MKKLNDASILFFVLLSTCLGLSACNDDTDDFPKDYVGFESPIHKVECYKNQPESELEVTIIAMEKSKEDRTVLLTVPPPPKGQSSILKLTENKVTIKARKKYAKTIFKIFPDKMVLKQQSISISCSPQQKDSKGSTLTILFNQKEENKSN